MAYVNFGRKNTKAEALASTNKDKIFFPTDSNTIVMGGKEYGGDVQIVDVENDFGYTGDDALFNVNKPIATTGNLHYYVENETLPDTVWFCEAIGHDKKNNIINRFFAFKEGLPLCRAILSHTNGKVYIYSAPRDGSVELTLENCFKTTGCEYPDLLLSFQVARAAMNDDLRERVDALEEIPFDSLHEWILCYDYTFYPLSMAQTSYDKSHIITRGSIPRFNICEGQEIVVKFTEYKDGEDIDTGATGRVWYERGKLQMYTNNESQYLVFNPYLWAKALNDPDYSKYHNDGNKVSFRFLFNREYISNLPYSEFHERWKNGDVLFIQITNQDSTFDNQNPGVKRAQIQIFNNVTIGMMEEVNDALESRVAALEQLLTNYDAETKTLRLVSAAYDEDDKSIILANGLYYEKQKTIIL